MNDSTPPGEHHSEDWAPHDYTDGRQKGNWETKYPEKAKKWIRIEAAYLVLLFFASLGALFYILDQLCRLPAEQMAAASDVAQNCPPFFAYAGALVTGILGGCCYGIKWMYHSVAKQIWHEDRRLWRLLTPPLSGVVALFTIFLISSGLLQIFDRAFMQRPIAIIALSFVVGYFSDKALAKMAELADTLFGRTDKGQ
jgi:hypothetical protein